MANWPVLGDLTTHLQMTDAAAVEERRPQLQLHLDAAVEHVQKRCGSHAPTAVPASLRLAVLIIAAHLWELQRTPGARTQLYGGSGVSTPLPRGYAIPNRAVELMAPYRTRAVG